jgi:glycosyltransferase involved in cell wall biosynthesis
MDYRPAMWARTGIGRYVAALAGVLARDACDLRLFGVFLSGNRPAVRTAPAGARLVAWKVPVRLIDLLGTLRVLPAERAVGGCDVWHHTNYMLARVSPRVPQVMTVHDLAWRRVPGCHTERAGEALDAILAAAVGRCAAFLVPSEATARDVEELLGVARDRIHVAPLGVEPAFFDLPARAPAGRPYVLAVGTLEPRKNYPRLIRAFRKSGLDADLRIVGKRGWLSDEVVAAAGDGVAWLGHVPEVELRALLAGAAAVAYPSLLEGFGLPVLEALAAGKPVLTSDIEPLRSVAGDAAVLVDPRDEEAIADGLRRVVNDSDLRADLARRGPARAREFTWERCAAATRAAYEAVA